MLTRKKPLISRTPLKRSAPIGKRPAPNSSLTRAKILVKSPIKRRARKKRSWHDAKMRNACRDQICYLRVPGVCHQLEREDTIVPCHSNEGAHGKAGQRKADDRYTVPGCGLCHFWLDFGGAPQLLKYSTWRRAYREWSTVRDGTPDESVGEIDG
ncbi:hypothetical protein [Paraburkholderia sp. SIMBA_030]|uniref:hypothetical protein n=1 Tax=Paraburkholderia sp. SIMBA_030 TaxID=3085773 RepID=UPI00397E7C27